ncbi:unnamed protein product, partial [Mesorhabditis belari]|uniref:Uncharacterized protein n=1 Tax=Mesorhabditis belari TaxID=2138241 RepID=A0AAF3J316_9BILA
MIQEFDKITKLLREQFLETLLQMKYLDYRENVADVITYGTNKMGRFLDKKLAQNLEEFKEWCSLNAPIDVATKLLTRISGGTSILQAFLAAQNYNHKSYRAFENGIIGHMRLLELLMANCEAVQPISSNNSIFHDFAEIENQILTQLASERKQLESTFWPGKVSELSVQCLNQSDTKVAAEQFAQDLAAKHEPKFFVATSNVGDKVPIIYYTGDRVVYGWNLFNKNFVVFRSPCAQNETQRQEVITPTDSIVAGNGDNYELIAKLIWEQVGVQSAGNATKSAMVLAVPPCRTVACLADLIVDPTLFRAGDPCAVYVKEKNGFVYVIGLD